MRSWSLRSPRPLSLLRKRAVPESDPATRLAIGTAPIEREMASRCEHFTSLRVCLRRLLLKLLSLPRAQANKQ